MGGGGITSQYISMGVGPREGMRFPNILVERDDGYVNLPKNN